MYNSGYFFSKYIDANLSVAKKNTLFSTTAFCANSSNTEKSMSHYVFQYNFLNSSFLSSIRERFFKYDITITCSKKGTIKFLFPTLPKKYFFSSSFVVSFPVKSCQDVFINFNLIRNHTNTINFSSRFSNFPIAIFFDNISVPIEYADFFFLNIDKLEIFFNNVKFSSFIVINFYSRQIFILNNSFSKNGNY